MKLDAEGVRRALAALDSHLQTITDQRLELVVCGGAALEFLGLVDRATKDVDVLAIAQRDAQQELLLLNAKPLPVVLKEPIRLVARDLQLADDWLNAGPSDLLSAGLPEGILSRLIEVDFGRCLNVLFVGRVDQICLKLYAVVDSGPSERHLLDLRALNPSDDEMRIAAQWTMTQDASEIFPALVRDCLRKIGYEHVASSV